MGGPGGQQVGHAQGRPTQRSCPDLAPSGTPGGRFTEVEVTEFLQTYKIHISVCVVGAATSQEGRRLPGAGPPPACPASGPGDGWQSRPSGPQGPAGLHTGPAWWARRGLWPPQQLGGRVPHTRPPCHTLPGISPESWQQQKGSKERSGVQAASTTPVRSAARSAHRPLCGDRQTPAEQEMAAPPPRSGSSEVLWSTSTRHWQPRAPGSATPVGSSGPHPCTPTPGTRGAEGTGSEEASGIPKLPPRDPPC